MEYTRFTLADTSHSLGPTPVPVVGDLMGGTPVPGGSFRLDVLGRNFVKGKSVIRLNGDDVPTTFNYTWSLTAMIPSRNITASGWFPITVFNTGGGGLSNAYMCFVNPGGPVSLGIETAPDGLGTVVPAESLEVAQSLQVFSVARDTAGAFKQNIVPDSWSLENITGGIQASDLVPGGNSAVFTAHSPGSAVIKATYGYLKPVPSGKITVKVPTGAAKEPVPLTYALMQNFPNPFNPSTQIRFDLPFAGDVSLVVFDVLGQKVASLASGHYPAGHHSVVWNATGCASGVYFYRLQAGNAAEGKTRAFVSTKSLLLMR
jgi:hypothetical protein